MGYRAKQQWSEEVPYQGIDPQTLQTFKGMGEEAYARSNQQQSRQDQMNSETLALQRQGMSDLGDGIKEGVQTYKAGKRQDRADTLENARFDREGKQSEESLATMKQQRNLAAVEDQRRAESHPLEQQERAARVAGTEAETKGKVSAQAFADAVSTQKDADGVETNAMYERRKGLEAQGYSAETARLQVQNETQNLAQKKAMAPLEMAQAKAGIRASDAQVGLVAAQRKDMEDAKRLKGLTARFQAVLAAPTNDPQGQQAQLSSLTKEMQAAGAKPGEISEAIIASKANNQQQMMGAALVDQTLNPGKAAEKSYNSTRYLEGKQRVDTMVNVISDMKTEADKFRKTGAVPTAESEQALNNIKKMMIEADYTDLAADLDSRTDGVAGLIPKKLGGTGTIYPGGGDYFGRQEKMDRAIATFKEREQNKANALAKTDPTFTAHARRLAEVKAGPPTRQEVALKYAPTSPQQTMVGDQMSRAPASVGGLQGLPGVKIRPQVGSK